MRMKCLFLLICVAAVSPRYAQGVVWSGLDYSFSKVNYADWTAPENQDWISSNVHITRQNNEGLFNIVLESGYQGWDTSPMDTEWAFSGLNGCATFSAGSGAVQHASLTFDNFARALYVNVGDYIVGTPGVVHLISEDIYIDILFTSWQKGGAGGGFAYNRASSSPTVTTGAASDITMAAAKLNGVINAWNYSTTATFEYGLDTGYGTTVTADQSPVTGATNTAVSCTIGGLTLNTTYHYRAVGQYSLGTINGADMTFTTLADTDGDGEPDITDGCPNDPNKITPGICGCGVADIDSDGDGSPDCNDRCPNDANKMVPGVCGCGVSDIDSDNDGTLDCNDLCPNDPNKTDPGIFGCGVSDDDTDNDGTPDDNDACPNDPDKTNPGVCGCGVSDMDTDNDGIPDCNDDTPNGVWDDYDDDDADFCDFIPVAVLPLDGAVDTSPTPTFVIDWDIDPDTCGDHHKTRWQISERPDFYGLTYNKNTIGKDPFSHNVAPGVLTPDTTYYWRARVWCSQECKSRYSEAVSFTTAPDPNDNNQPGNQGNHSRGVNAVVGNQYVTIETSENITFLQALDNNDQDILDGMPDNMPWGLINFRIEIATPGDTVQITIFFEEKARNNAVFYKYDPVEGWIDYSDHATFAPDMKSVTIEIQDGGFGDMDGTVNGVIVDPCGIGTFASGGGGGGGCFIDSTSLTR